MSKSPASRRRSSVRIPRILLFPATRFFDVIARLVVGVALPFLLTRMSSFRLLMWMFCSATTPISKLKPSRYTYAIWNSQFTTSTSRLLHPALPATSLTSTLSSTTLMEMLSSWATSMPIVTAGSRSLSTSAAICLSIRWIAVTLLSSILILLLASLQTAILLLPTSLSLLHISSVTSRGQSLKFSTAFSPLHLSIQTIFRSLSPSSTRSTNKTSTPFAPSVHLSISGKLIGRHSLATLTVFFLLLRLRPAPRVRKFFETRSIRHQNGIFLPDFVQISSQTSHLKQSQSVIGATSLELPTRAILRSPFSNASCVISATRLLTPLSIVSWMTLVTTVRQNSPTWFAGSLASGFIVHQISPFHSPIRFTPKDLP